MVWPEGHYLLDGTVEYRRDTRMAEKTVRSDFHAELDIEPGGSMSLRDSSGPCRESQTTGTPQEGASPVKTFWCNDVSFVLRPAAGTVAGEVRVWVTEAIHRQGLCSRTGIVNGMQVCVAYDRVLSQETVDKAAVLEVLQIYPGPERSSREGILAPLALF